MEGLRTVKAEVAAFVHPSRASDVTQGVHEILNSRLLRFNEELNGVMLAYLVPRLVSRTAKILSGLCPYFHVILTAKLLLFSPTPGLKIEGKVNKIEKEYIGVVVLGVFNSTIGVDDIRDDLDFSTEETEHIIDICGSLAEYNTGSVDWLERYSSRSKKKGSKEGKLRSTEDKSAKRKKSKDRRECDVQEPECDVQEPTEHQHGLQENHKHPTEETVQTDKGPIILPKYKKRKKKESG